MIMDPAPLRLGLIGDNIAASGAPRLHVLAGTQIGRQVSYDRLVPPERGESFEAVFEAARAEGYRGLNITYPYKERVLDLVEPATPLIAAIGAVNTVLFEGTRAVGHNTDFSGFHAAYTEARGPIVPGSVLIIGTGGVGRAIGFALARLGASALRLVDRDMAKTGTLAADLARAFPSLELETGSKAGALATGVDGIVNCTPVGMVGMPGSPIDRAAIGPVGWAFDAVYTPRDTQFLHDAAACGRLTISGWELFFHQGVDAFALFSGKAVDAGKLRAHLLAEAAGP